MPETSFLFGEETTASWKENAGVVLQACVAIPCMFVSICSVLLLARTIFPKNTKNKNQGHRYKHGHRHDERTSLMGHEWDRQSILSPSLTGSPTAPRFVPSRPALQMKYKSPSNNCPRVSTCVCAAACTATAMLGVCMSLLCADWLVGDDDWHMGLFEGCDDRGLLPYLHVCSVSFVLIDDYTEHLVAALLLLLALCLGLCVGLLSVFAACCSAKVAGICQVLLIMMAPLVSLALVCVASSTQYSVAPGLWVGPCYVACGSAAVLLAAAALLAHLATTMRSHTQNVHSEHRKVLWRRENVLSGRGSYSASHHSSKASYMPCSSDSEESDDFYPIDSYHYRHAREPQRFL